jgi:chorismate mutase
MQEIDKLRSQIDQLHIDLTTLFRKRLEITEKIWEIKKSQKLAFFDPTREEAIIHQFDKSLASENEKIAVQNFLKSVLTETKKYLEVKIK